MIVFAWTLLALGVVLLTLAVAQVFAERHRGDRRQSTAHARTLVTLHGNRRSLQVWMLRNQMRADAARLRRELDRDLRAMGRRVR